MLKASFGGGWLVGWSEREGLRSLGLTDTGCGQDVMGVWGRGRARVGLEELQKGAEGEFLQQQMASSASD